MRPADGDLDDDADLDPSWLDRLFAAEAELAARPGGAGRGPGWEAGCLELIDRACPGDQAPTPAAIDRYRVIRELGRGGFGVVYQAHDPGVGRDVAIKTPLPALAHSPAVRRRFTREALAVAGLDHPNIIPVHDAQTVGPVAFLVSTYCPGPSLAAWLRARVEPVPCREAARLVAGLARGVAHAHARGILHRDLKPANVMLQPADPPGAGGMTPRVTDFGLAKVVDEVTAEQTRVGLVIGSAPYMAPEQAAATGGPVGPAVDIYALGVILYEILVGRPPFLGRSQVEVLHQVVHGHLVAPGLLRSKIPRDLQTICLHALRRNPRSRYPTAAALADDLDRFLAGESIVARPPSGLERAWRWSGRHPVAATSLAAAALLAGVIHLETRWANARLREGNERLARAAERADHHAREVDRLLHAARLNLARQAIEAGQDERAQAILVDEAAGGGPPRRDFSWNYLWNLSRRHLAVWGHHEAKIGAVALAADGVTLASGDRSGTIRLWDVAAGRPRRAFGHHAGAVERLAFAPDGRILAAGTWGGIEGQGGPRVDLWDVTTGQALATLGLPEACLPGRLAFLDGGRTLMVLVVDGERGQRLQGWRLTREGAAGAAVIRLEPCFAIHGCLGVVEAPDGGSFWVIEADGRIIRRDAQAALVLRTLRCTASPPAALARSADGRWLAAVVAPARVLVWELAQDGPPRVLADLAVRPDELIFRPGGDALLAVSAGVEARLIALDGTGDLPVLPLDLDRRGRLGFRFSPDGRWLASSGEVRPGGLQPVTVFAGATGRAEKVFPGRLPVVQAEFAARGDALLLVGEYDVASWRAFEPPPAAVHELGDHADEVWSVAFSPDGRWLASGGDDNRLRLWDPATLNRLPVSHHSGTVGAVAWHPGGRTVASGILNGEAENLQLWDPASGKPVATLLGHTAQVRAVAFSPDGAVFASAGTDRVIRLWDGLTGAPLGQLAGHDDVVRGLAFGRDGRHLASAGNDATVRIWDWAGRREVTALTGRFQVSAIAFAPDGRTLASADEGGSILLRNSGTWDVRREMRCDDREVRALAFSPDGATLAAGGKSRAIQLWDPASGQPLMELRDERTEQINGLAFSPDGATLAAADHGGRVLLYRARGGR